MAAARSTSKGVEKKRRSKKKRSRTEISSASDTESEQEQQKPEEKESSEDDSPEPIPEPSKKAKKKSKAVSNPNEENDISMVDAEASPAPVASISWKPQSLAQTQSEFSTMYLRKITTELADDLDKVREAQDFKANSVPMLIHALKQGESLFSVEEKRRVVAAANQ